MARYIVGMREISIPFKQSIMDIVQHPSDPKAYVEKIDFIYQECINQIMYGMHHTLESSLLRIHSIMRLDHLVYDDAELTHHYTAFSNVVLGTAFLTMTHVWTMVGVQPGAVDVMLETVNDDYMIVAVYPMHQEVLTC